MSFSDSNKGSKYRRKGEVDNSDTTDKLALYKTSLLAFSLYEFMCGEVSDCLKLYFQFLV